MRKKFTHHSLIIGIIFILAMISSWQCTQAMKSKILRKFGIFNKETDPIHEIQKVINKEGEIDQNDQVVFEKNMQTILDQRKKEWGSYNQKPTFSLKSEGAGQLGVVCKQEDQEKLELCKNSIKREAKYCSLTNPSKEETLRDTIIEVTVHHELTHLKHNEQLRNLDKKGDQDGIENLGLQVEEGIRLWIDILNGKNPKVFPKKSIEQIVSGEINPFFTKKDLTYLVETEACFAEGEYVQNPYIYKKYLKRTYKNENEIISNALEIRALIDNLVQKRNDKSDISQINRLIRVHNDYIKPLKNNLAKYPSCEAHYKFQCKFNKAFYAQNKNLLKSHKEEWGSDSSSSEEELD
jgi:hypothetical protein